MKRKPNRETRGAEPTPNPRRSAKTSGLKSIVPSATGDDKRLIIFVFRNIYVARRTQQNEVTNLVHLRKRTTKIVSPKNLDRGVVFSLPPFVTNTQSLPSLPQYRTFRRHSTKEAIPGV